MPRSKLNPGKPNVEHVKAIHFDLDNTLLNRNWAFETTIRQMLAGEGGPALSEPETQEGLLAEIIRLDNSGRGDKAKIYKKLAAAGICDKLDEGAFAMHLRQGIAKNVQWTAGACEALQHLRTRGYKLSIVTNGSRGQLGKINTLGLERLVDAVVISEVCGMTKPSPGIYWAAMEMLGVQPADSTFVGDSVVHDLMGAKAVGMVTILYTGAISEKTVGNTWDCVDEVADSFSRILEILNPAVPMTAKAP